MVRVHAHQKRRKISKKVRTIVRIVRLIKQKRRGGNIRDENVRVAVRFFSPKVLANNICIFSKEETWALGFLWVD